MTPATTFAAVRIGSSVFPFTSHEEVSRAYSATIDRLGLGSSKAPACSLLDDNGAVAGYVSYNGRVWLGRPETWDSAVCVYDPSRPS
jgi:hypothetical protein